MGASRPPLRNLTALHVTPSLAHHGCAAAELALWTLGLRGIKLLVSTACVCSPASMVAASTNCVSLTWVAGLRAPTGIWQLTRACSGKQMRWQSWHV